MVILIKFRTYYIPKNEITYYIIAKEENFISKS